MAKAKKKVALSLEEMLEQALVPVDEQPYEVPENWCWTYLRNIAQWGSGGTPSRKNPTYYEGNIPWVKTGELEDGILYNTEEKISDEAVQKSSAKLFPVESVLIAMYGATIGKTAILGVEATTNQACACAICNESVYNKYLLYYLRSQKDSFIEQGKGGAQPNISQDIIKRNTIPLPPKAEQQRIVEQIENLFVKLDEAKEKAGEIVDKFENTERAILFSAFAGKLTKNWRLKNSISNDTWSEVTLQDVCNMKITDGTHKTPTYCEQEDGGIPFISAKDVTSKKIFWDNIKYIVPELHEELYARLAPQRDDVLLAKNGTTGVAAIVEDDRVFDIYVTLAVLRPNKTIINPRYLLNVINSPVCKTQFDEHLTGIGVPNLHLRDIKDVKIPVPSLDEQDEIIRIVESLISKETKAYELAKITIESIEMMKKTVLAKAFRGELGTNNPDEESAIKLLSKIVIENK